MSVAFITYLNASSVPYVCDVNVSKLSSARIGGSLAILVYPQNTCQLIGTIKYLKKCEIEALIQGRFTNTLFKDSKTTIPVICTSSLQGMHFYGERVVCECGVSLPRLSAECQSRGLSGLEPLSGIPGSIGASVIGNAGAFGRELCELITSVTVFDTRLLEVHTLTPEECDFSYRCSSLSDRYAVLSCELHLKEASERLVHNESLRIKELRISSQPVGVPSLGSVFRKTKIGSAAKLIDACGLKGRRIGGCEISSKHAGFIVNTGGGSDKDYLSLMELAKASVYKAYGVRLTPEIKIR